MERAEEIFERILKNGELTIEEFIETQKSEELFLDFKVSADSGNGTSLNTNDRNNLEKAISGFGNSEGGVIVWGVKCSSSDKEKGDVPSEKNLIQNVKRFVSWLENAVSGCVIPVHSKVVNKAIIVDEKNGSGFAITYIPKSNNSPHQAVHDKKYYIRAGSNFIPTPHDVLAGMFGKRPQPNIVNMFVVGSTLMNSGVISIQIGFLLHNLGPGIARDIFISTQVKSSPGKKCIIGFDTPDLDNWTGAFSFGQVMNLISKPEYRIAPEAHAQPIILKVDFIPPFTDKIKINISCGCEGSVILKSSLENEKESIQKIYNETINKPCFDDIYGHEVAEKLLGRTIIS